MTMKHGFALHEQTVEEQFSLPISSFMKQFYYFPVVEAMSVVFPRCFCAAYLDTQVYCSALPCSLEWQAIKCQPTDIKHSFGHRLLMLHCLPAQIYLRPCCKKKNNRTADKAMPARVIGKSLQWPCAEPLPEPFNSDCRSTSMVTDQDSTIKGKV